MRPSGVRLAVGLVALLSVGLQALQRQAPAAAAGLAAPGCSTAVATGPALPRVATSFVTNAEVPFGVAISADSKTAFVADASGAIVVFSLHAGRLTLERVDSFRVNQHDQPPPPPFGQVSPLGAVLTPNGRYLVAAAGSGAVVFSVAGLEQEHSGIPAWTAGLLRSSGQGAIEAAVSPGGDYVFVTLEYSDELAVFDLKKALHARMRPALPTGTIPLGVLPVGIAIAPGGKYLYVTSEAATINQNEGTLTTIDLARAERDPSRAIVSTVPAGCSPVRVVATKSSVYVTARGSDALLAFDAHDLADDPGSALETEVQVGEAPVGLALVDHDRTVVVADSDRFSAPGAGASLAVVTIGKRNQFTLAGYVQTGSFPRDMAVSHDGRVLLVSDFTSGQVEAVEVHTLPSG